MAYPKTPSGRQASSRQYPGIDNVSSALDLERDGSRLKTCPVCGAGRTAALFDDTKVDPVIQTSYLRPSLHSWTKLERTSLRSWPQRLCGSSTLNNYARSAAAQ